MSQQPSHFGSNNLHHGRRGGRGGSMGGFRRGRGSSDRGFGRHSGGNERHHQQQQRNRGGGRRQRHGNNEKMGNVSIEAQSMPVSSLYGCPPPPSPPPPPPPPVQQESYSYPGNYYGPQGDEHEKKRTAPSESNSTTHLKKQKSNDSTKQTGADVGSSRGLQSVTVSVPGCKPQQFHVCVGNHPDDIKEWIKARKERFPTRANIAKKLQEQQARKQLPFPSTSAGASSTGAHASKEQCNLSQANAIPKTGLASLLDGYDSSSSEDEDHKNEKGTTTVGETAQVMETTAKLSREDAANVQVEGQTIIQTTTTNTTSNNNPTVPEDRRNNNIHSSKKRDSNNTWKQKRRNRGIEIRGTPLLQKLLSRDMEREAVLTLQCLSFIVQQDFLQKTSSSITTGHNNVSQSSEPNIEGFSLPN